MAQGHTTIPARKLFYPCKRALAIGLICCPGLGVSAGKAAVSGSSAAMDAVGLDGLPQPPRGEIEMRSMNLNLELVVNTLNTEHVVSVQMRDDHYYVAASDLAEAGIPVSHDGPGLVAIDTLPDTHVEYDASNLRLLVNVPTSDLPGQQIGQSKTYDFREAKSSLGALLNYEAYATDPQNGPAGFSLYSEARIFGEFGVLSSTGTYSHGNGAAGANGFRRYDTNWRYSDERRALTYEAGDLITGSLAWTNAVRMGGIQISRDFSVRPDLITYPLPHFSGQAAVPTTVDLFINGYAKDSQEVKPGPFTLTDIPFINGAGQAVVVVTDALGRRVSTTTSFYVAGDLLRPGLADFSVAAGAIRTRYGISDFSYGTGVASGTWRYGISDGLTMEAHGEASGSLGLLGVGTLVKLFDVGVLNASWSESRTDGREGHQWAVGYQYVGRRFTLTAQHIGRNVQFADISTLDVDHFDLARQSTTVSGSVSLFRFGNVGAGYIGVTARDRSKTRLANLSWSLPLYRNISLYVSGNRDLESRHWAFSTQIIIPLGRDRGTATGSFQQTPDGNRYWRADYDRSIPLEGGIGANLSYADGENSDRYIQADLGWRNRLFEVHGGLYGSKGDYTRWASASGSLIMMDGAAFVSQRVNDAFAVVTTHGEPDVPVRYENQLVGTTDRSGHLLIPWVVSYYPAKYSIDPLALPVAAETPLVEQHASIKRGSGYLIDFPVNHVVAALIPLRGKDGKVLPVGTAVLVNGQDTIYVGWDGLAYVEGLSSRNQLVAQLPNGTSCSLAFAMDVHASQIARLPAATCQ